MSKESNPSTGSRLLAAPEGSSQAKTGSGLAPQSAEAASTRSDTLPESRWLAILNSSAVTTLITVVLGGIAGQLILSGYQDRQKDREVAQEELHATIQKRQDIIQKALDLLGEVRFDAESLIQLCQPVNDPRYYSSRSREQKEVEARRDKLRENHSDALRKWDTGRSGMGVLLAYYNFGDRGVKTAWDNTADATTEFLNCAEDAYTKSQSPGPAIAKPCSTERTGANDALTKLSDALELANQKAWGTEKP